MFVGIKAELNDMQPFEEIEPELDKGIKEAVRLLREGGFAQLNRVRVPRDMHIQSPWLSSRVGQRWAPLPTP